MTSNADINGNEQPQLSTVAYVPGACGKAPPCRGWIELLMRCSRTSVLPGRPRAVEGHSLVTNVDRCRQLGSRSGSRSIRRPQVTAADDQLWLCSS